MRFFAALVTDVALTAIQLRTDGRHRLTSIARRTSPGDLMYQSIRQAWGSLAHARGFSASVIGALALGVGATATLFTLTDRLLLSTPPHISQPSELRRIHVHGMSTFTRKVEYSAALSYPDFLDLSATPNAQLAGLSQQEMTFGEVGATQRIRVELATANYFPLVGVRPALGRFFDAADDEVGAPLTAVVSHGFWQRQFGGDPAILGKPVRLGQGTYSIIGVAPRNFTGVDVGRVEFWLPLRAAQGVQAGTAWATSRRWYWLSAIARIDPTIEARTAAEATRRYRAGRSSTRNPDPNATVLLTSIISGRGPDASDESRVAPALAGLALMVLLLSCANVANLVLARGIRRRRTFAIQTALGLSRARLVLLATSEVVLLSIIGGVLGLMITRVATPVLFRTLLPSAAIPSAFSLRIAAFMAVVIAVTAILTGVLPALRSTRVDAFEVLRSTRETRRASAVRLTLLGVQAGLCAFLLVGAGMFMRSLQRARSTDVGVDMSTLTVLLELTDGSRFGTDVAKASYAPLERLRALPRVDAAAVTSLPHFYGNLGITLFTDSDSIANGGRGPFYYSAGGQYFESTGLRVLRGRALTDADDVDGAAPIAVLSSSLARLAFGSLDVIGRCIYLHKRERCSQVVGVVEDALPGVRASAPNYNLYVPPHHPDLNGLSAGTLVVRVSGNPTGVMNDIRRVVLESASNIRLVEVKPFSSLLEGEFRSWRLGSALLTTFGALALLVSIAGIAASLLFDVAQRRFELAVRSALGASSSALVRTSTMRSIAVCGIGMAVGLLLALGAAARASSLLFHVSPVEPTVIFGVVGTILAATVVATAIPAWRAVRADPKTALQSE